MTTPETTLEKLMAAIEGLRLKDKNLSYIVDQSKLILSDEDCETAQIFFRDHVLTLQFNPNFVDSLPPKELIAIVEHECYHFLLGHLFMSHEDSLLLNICADAIINQFITNLPRNCVNGSDLFCLALGVPIGQLPYDEAIKASPTVAKDLTTCNLEHHYFLAQQFNADGKRVPQLTNVGTYFKGRFYDMGADASVLALVKCMVILSKKKKEDLEKAIEEILQRLGKRLPSHKPSEGSEINEELARDIVEVFIEREKNSSATRRAGKGSLRGDLNLEKIWSKKISWDRELKHLLNLASSALSYSSSWKRPNRRFGVITAGAAPQPTLKIAVVCDTSGSVDAKLLGLVSDCLKQLSDSNVVVTPFPVVYCDTKVAGEETFKIKLRSPKGGGGTDMAPGIEYAMKKFHPDIVLICTDGFVPSFSLKINTKKLVWLICSTASAYRNFMVESNEKTMPGTRIVVEDK